MDTAIKLKELSWQGYIMRIFVTSIYQRV